MSTVDGRNGGSGRHLAEALWRWRQRGLLGLAVVAIGCAGLGGGLIGESIRRRKIRVPHWSLRLHLSLGLGSQWVDGRVR